MLLDPPLLAPSLWALAPVRYDFDMITKSQVLSHVLKQRDSSQLTSASTFWIRKDELLTSDKTL